MTASSPSIVDGLHGPQWLPVLISEGRRPNLLISSDRDLPSMAARVAALCRESVRVCALPGELSLPETPEGTLLIWDVASLTLGQQIQLYDWMTRRPANARLICITSVPLWPLVQGGAFLEGLLHRISAVALTVGGRGHLVSRAFEEPGVHAKAGAIRRSIYPFVSRS